MSRASVVPHAPAPTTATRGPAISAPCVAARLPHSARPARRGHRRASQLLAARQLHRRPVTKDQSDRRPVEAEPIAQLVLEVAPVAEMDRRGIRGEEDEGRRARRQPGSHRTASAGGRGRAAAAFDQWPPISTRLSSPVEIRLRRSPQMSIGRLQHASDALARLRADRDDRGKVEERDLVPDPFGVLVEGPVRLVGDQVPLVDRDDQALAFLDDVARDMCVLGGQALRPRRSRGPQRPPATGHGAREASNTVRRQARMRPCRVAGSRPCRSARPRCDPRRAEYRSHRASSRVPPRRSLAPHREAR